MFADFDRLSLLSALSACRQRLSCTMIRGGQGAALIACRAFFRTFWAVKGRLCRPRSGEALDSPERSEHRACKRSRPPSIAATPLNPLKIQKSLFGSGSAGLGDLNE